MIIEGLKTILGEDLAKQVETALQGKGKDGKDIDLVIGNDGSFVPADKFDALKTQSTSAEKALKAAADALKAVGGSGDPAKIADDVATAQNTITTLQTNHDAEIKKIQKSTALKMALNGKVHDPSDIMSLLDMDKIDVDDTGSLKNNLDDLLKPIKETKSYLFKEESGATPPDIKGAKPAEPGGQAKPPVKIDGPVIL